MAKSPHTGGERGIVPDWRAIGITRRLEVHDRVACHCRTVMLYFWHDLHVSACQLDELWSFVHTKEAHLPGAKLYCDTYGDAWVWIAFAPVWRLVLAFVIGKRDQAGADLLLARVAHVTDDFIPLFTIVHQRSIARLPARLAAHLR